MSKCPMRIKNNLWQWISIIANWFICSIQNAFSLPHRFKAGEEKVPKELQQQALNENIGSEQTQTNEEVAAMERLPVSLFSQNVANMPLENAAADKLIFNDRENQRPNNATNVVYSYNPLTVSSDVRFKANQKHTNLVHMHHSSADLR